MDRRFKKIIISVICLVLYAVYYFGIPAVLNTQKCSTFIQKIVKNGLGLNIELKSPKIKMGILPSIWLYAEKFQIKDFKQSPLIIEEPKLKISLLPLITKKIHVLYFYGKNINADLKIDKNNRFFIGNYMIMKVSDSKITVENAKINLFLYKIKFKDERYNKNILLNGNYLNIDNFNPQKHIKFSTDSNFTVGNTSSYIKARINMEL